VDTLRRNGYFERAIELLREKTASEKIFGFKDPRAAKLLLFWKEVFAHSRMAVSYILVVRHPLSVCESLAKRDGFDFEKSYLLWLEHVMESLVRTEGENRVLVDYDCLMQAPQVEITKIAERFQLLIDKTELEKFKLEFLDPKLRHTTYPLDDWMLDETVPPLAREMYKELLSAARGNIELDDAMFTRKIAQWKNEFSRQRSALLLADKLTLKIYQVMGEQKQTIQALTAEVADQAQNLKTLSAQIEELNQVKGSRVWQFIQALRKLQAWLISHKKVV
jgi:hypothetical protein